MHLFDCLGNIEHNKCDLNLVKDELHWWNTRIDNELDTVSYKNTKLFNLEYQRNLSLGLHLNELISFARKYYQFLSKAARNTVMPTSVGSADYQDYGFLRWNIVELFVFIRTTLMDIRTLLERRNIDKAKLLLKDIQQNIYSFRLMLKSIDNLPDFVIRNSTSEVGNQSLLASFHLFHTHLELHWLHLTTMLEIYAVEDAIDRETFPNIEDQFLMEEFNEDVQRKEYNPSVEKEIEWFLYNLILLSSKCYEKMGAKHVFSCSCVKQLWLATQLIIENMNSQNKCADFWYYYNRTVDTYVLKTETNTDLAQSKSCNVLFKMNKIKCINKYEFSMWLLINVVQLHGYDSNGHFVGITTSRVTPNYTHLESVLKQFLESETNVNESTLRGQMRHVVKLLTVWWEPSNTVVTLLWEYFHKRLNSTFTVVGREDTTLSFAKQTAPSIMNNLKSRFTFDNSAKRDYTCENSFSLFITLLGVHLKKSIENNQHSNCQRIKGRILPKFTQNKLLALSDIGLEHFASIFLIMAISTDFQDMCTKLQNLLNQLPYDTLSWPGKQVILKTYICILYMYVDSGCSIENISGPLLSIANKYSAMRDTESTSVVRNILLGIQDVLDVSQQFECSEYLFIDSWLPRHLLICTLTELTNTLESMCCILNKLNVLCSYHGVSPPPCQPMVDRMFQHILPSVRTLYGNGTISLQIASIAFTFTKFIFDNEEVLQSHEKFTDICKYFLLCETGNEKLMHHYLTQLLQDERMCESFLSKNKQCVRHLIHCWIRCTLLSAHHSDDDTHTLLLLSQLPEFSALSITPSCSTGDHRNLCNFFRSIGAKWNQSQNFQEKCQLREAVNEYLSSMDKYILSGLKAPPSVEYVLQIFLVLGTLFINCSPIIYSRAKPTCLLHSIVNNILLPPQLLMDMKVHPYTISGVCKSWYMFMRGLYVLDYKNDVYIDKIMKDMIVQYVPHFVSKPLLSKNTFEVSYRIIPNDTTNDLILEKYILDRISLHFLTCRGKQSHVHAPKALAVVNNLIISTANVKLISVTITCTFVSVCEQYMFSDMGSVNKKIAGQIIESICKSHHFTQPDIRDNVREMLIATCKKHIAFNSSTIFKLLLEHTQVFHPVMDAVLSSLDSEISKVESMRGVGYDHGLRNGLKGIITAYSKLQSD